MARAAQGRLGLAGRRDRDQGPDRGRLPPAERQQRADRRPERRGGAGDADDVGDQPRRAAPAGRARVVPVLPARRQPGRFVARTAGSASSPTSCRTGSTNVTWRDLAHDLHRARPPRSTRRQERGRRGPGPDLPLHLRHPAVPRPAEVGRRLRVLVAATTRDKADPPSKLFSDVLRDGPPLGIHTIVWCDSVNNLNRTFDRQGVREFENRILFQMSANDSSTLIDSARGQQAGREPGALLQRGREPDREVPAVRPARGRMAGEVKARFAAAAGARGGRRGGGPGRVGAGSRSGRNARARLRRRQRRADGPRRWQWRRPR